MLKVSINKIISERSQLKTVLLSNVEFELVENSIYTIVGKNGSGKTTFIKSLTGLLDKKFFSVHGKVVFEGNDLLSLNQEELRLIRKRRIKYVFQDAKNSFDHLRKIGYYFNVLESNPTETDELLSYFLLPKSKELFQLYPYEVSGGMAQRVSLVLAILAKPSLIFLDEPTSGIDSAIANLFLLKLKKFIQNNASSVLLVTQDLTFADRISDKIALLSDRRLSPFLTPSEFFSSKDILNTNDLLPSYLEMQR